MNVGHEERDIICRQKYFFARFWRHEFQSNGHPLNLSLTYLNERLFFYLFYNRPFGDH